MGLELRGPVLRYACALLTGGLLVTALATPAAAQDPTPAPNPVSTLPPPSQQQIDDAKNALDRLRGPARPTRATTATPTTITQVAGPVSPGRASVATRVSAEAWWTIGAGVLVLLVLSETSRITVRRAKHRKGA